MPVKGTSRQTVSLFSVRVKINLGFAKSSKLLIFFIILPPFSPCHPEYRRCRTGTVLCAGRRRESRIWASTSVERAQSFIGQSSENAANRDNKRSRNLHVVQQSDCEQNGGRKLFFFSRARDGSHDFACRSITGQCELGKSEFPFRKIVSNSCFLQA